jgi:hypothetical protein
MFSELGVFYNRDLDQIIGLYVDDMLVIGAGRQVVQDTVAAIGRL